MTPRSPLNYVFVKMQAFDDLVKTESGVKLYKDISYNPEWSTTVSAAALSTPAQVRQTNLDNEGIHAFVKQGDEVLFRYLVIMQRTEDADGFRYENQHLIDGEMYWKVDYSMILGVLRDGQLIPAPGYLFAKQIDKHNSDKVSNLYIPEMSKSEVVKNRAVVQYVGAPKNGVNKLQIVEGDTVIFPDKMAEKYEINGEKFLVLRQEYVMAKAI